MKRPQPALDEIFATQIRVLATTLRPHTVLCYRGAARNFLAYLHTTFPRLHKLSELRRNPHLLGGFRFLCQQYPPPHNRIRLLHLLCIRRLLRDLSDQGHPLLPDLIRHEDFPPRDHYLPRPLPLEQDSGVGCPDPRSRARVSSFLTASLPPTYDLVYGAAPHLGRNGPACGLHRPGPPAPAAPLLRNRDGAPRRYNSLPALMQMLGHQDIRMTLRYVEVVQLDLQREFHRARQNTASLYSIPQLPISTTAVPSTQADLATIRQTIAATRHLLQLLQPQLPAKARRKLRRLMQRLLNVDHELDHLT